MIRNNKYESVWTRAHLLSIVLSFIILNRFSCWCRAWAWAWACVRVHSSFCFLFHRCVWIGCEKWHYTRIVFRERKKKQHLATTLQTLGLLCLFTHSLFGLHIQLLRRTRSLTQIHCSFTVYISLHYHCHHHQHQQQHHQHHIAARRYRAPPN